MILNTYRRRYVMVNDSAQIKAQETLPVNSKTKDTFFKTVYATDERRRKLASFLLGMAAEKITTADVRPVLFGNKEND